MTRRGQCTARKFPVTGASPGRPGPSPLCMACGFRHAARASDAVHGTGAMRALHSLRRTIYRSRFAVADNGKIMMRYRHGLFLFTLLAAALVSLPASAHLPPAQPREFAAYGPFELCSERFNLTVGEGEALHVVGDIARIISDDHVLAVKFANDRDWFAKENGQGRAESSTVVSSRRASGTVPDAGDTVRFAPEGLGSEGIRYAVGIGRDAGDLIVGATGFDGSARDRALLDRIGPANMSKAGCVSLWHAMSRVSDTDPARAERQDLSGIANLYSARAASGPFHHCMAGVVFAVGSGETLHRPWRALGKSGPAYLEVDGARIAIEQRGRTLSRYNDQNAGEHPMALVQDSRAYFFPGIGVKPLDGDNLVREEATWRFDLGARGHSVALSVSFPAAQASAGMAFLERLEFAAPNDPRCD